MKRRRKTNSNVPAKGRLRDMADQLWSVAVRNDWAGKCAVCGSRQVEAHHLIPRQFEATRYELINGMALCSQHHKFDPHLSPHLNAPAWTQWLWDHYIERWEWVFQSPNPRPKFTGTKNAAHYIEHIRRLRQYVEPEDFERIVGVRFAAWLEEQP